MTPDVRSNRFLRVKEDHQNELAEDYVAEIARLQAQFGEARASDIAESFGVSKAAVSKSIARLRNDGLVESRPYRGIFLTPDGQKLAMQVSARYEIVFKTLIKLGVPVDVAHEDVEGIEHHCSPKTLAAMEKFLQNGEQQ